LDRYTQFDDDELEVVYAKANQMLPNFRTQQATGLVDTITDKGKNKECQLEK
jgi:hypothetical protein